MPLLPSGCGLGTNNNMSCYNCGSAPMGQSPGCTHHELWQLQQHHSISKRGIKQGPLGHHPFHINKSMLFDSHTEPTTQTHWHNNICLPQLNCTSNRPQCPCLLQVAVQPLHSAMPALPLQPLLQPEKQVRNSLHTIVCILPPLHTYTG